MRLSFLHLNVRSTDTTTRQYMYVHELTYDENSRSPAAGLGSSDGAVFVVDDAVDIEKGSCGLRSVDGHFSPTTPASPNSQKREREREMTFWHFATPIYVTLSFFTILSYSQSSI